MAKPKKRDGDERRGEDDDRNVRSVSDVAGEEEEEEQEEKEDGDEDEDDEEEEPRLKYSTVTSKLSAVFKGGDAVSTFMVAGDKMVA